MSTSGKSVKQTQPITLDPNFFIPPDVVDMRYYNLDSEGDSATVRSPDTGEIISFDYDDVFFSGEEDGALEAGTGTVSSILAAPDSLTVISQQVRVTSDGNFVVDVILEVEDIAGAIQYDIREAKP